VQPGIARCWNDNCTGRKAPTSAEEAGSSEPAEKVELNSGKHKSEETELDFDKRKRACQWTVVQLLAPPSESAEPEGEKEEALSKLLSLDAQKQLKTAKAAQGRQALLLWSFGALFAQAELDSMKRKRAQESAEPDPAA
jgi:hypothetical protein